MTTNPSETLSRKLRLAVEQFADKAFDAGVREQKEAGAVTQEDFEDIILEAHSAILSLVRDEIDKARRPLISALKKISDTEKLTPLMVHDLAKDAITASNELWGELG